MKRILITAFLFLIALSAPLAAEKVEGYLVDKMCSAKVIEGGLEAAKAHTKECAEMPNCKASGYGVVTDDGKFLKFDSDGDRMAAKVLGFFSREDNVAIVVNGDIKDDTITVVAIQLR